MANKTLYFKKSASSKKLKEQIIILNKIAFGKHRNLMKEDFKSDKDIILVRLFAIFEAAMKENILYFYDQLNQKAWDNINTELNKKAMPFGQFINWRKFVSNYHAQIMHNKYKEKIENLFRSHVAPIYELRNNVSHCYFESNEKEISAPEYLDAVFSLIQMHNVIATVFSCDHKISQQYKTTLMIHYNFTINND